MKFVRLFSRLALLSLAAAAFVGLTEIYVGSTRPPFMSPQDQAARLHRPPGPQIDGILEFAGESTALALFAAGGRIVFRLRLSGRSPSQERLISLNLRRVSPDWPGRE